MKRGKKLIVLFAVFVVILAAALLVMKLNPKEDVDANDRNYSTVVFSLDPEKVTNIWWDYSDETGGNGFYQRDFVWGGIQAKLSF